VVENLRNLRLPALNLDSVYGDGPTLSRHRPTEAADLYEGVRLKVGTAAPKDGSGSIPGDLVPPEDDLRRDLPRVNKKALVADGRNDENLIIAQFHTAFLRFHNAVADRLVAPTTASGTTRRSCSASRAGSPAGTTSGWSCTTTSRR
jgi:hypothetical protein